MGILGQLATAMAKNKLPTPGPVVLFGGSLILATVPQVLATKLSLPIVESSMPAVRSEVGSRRFYTGYGSFVISPRPSRFDLATLGEITMTTYPAIIGYWLFI